MAAAKWDECCAQVSLPHKAVDGVHAGGLGISLSLLMLHLPWYSQAKSQHFVALGIYKSAAGYRRLNKKK